MSPGYLAPRKKCDQNLKTNRVLLVVIVSESIVYVIECCKLLQKLASKVQPLLVHLHSPVQIYPIKCQLETASTSDWIMSALKNAN